MNKIKIEQMKCFDEVAKVIGAEKARVELQIAIEGYKEDLENVDSETDLISAFYWAATPQRHEFWNDINDGINLMKNNREIKVGQVREIVDEDIQYVILANPQDSNMTKIMILSGKEKGEVMYWRRVSLDEDIVVM